MCIGDASYRKAVVDCLEENTVKAMEQTGSQKLVIAGGVSANRLLRRRLQSVSDKRHWQFYCPEIRYCGDNAAMVGAQAYYEYQAGHTAGLDLNAKPELSIS